MTDIKDFAGRTALVTGAASGIGSACTRALAARGAAKLVLVDVDADALSALDLDCEVRTVIGSVASPELWSGLAEDLGTIDHAIVNAGIGGGGLFADLDFAEWRRVMDVNLDGAFLTLATAMRAMSENGGSVVVVSSATGVKAVPGTGPYGVAKAAVAHMARMAALEGAPNAIRVNAIAPGGVDTAIWNSSDDFSRSVEEHGRDATLKAMAGTTPRGRFATPDEMASSILYLLSDAAANITGHVLVDDGGYTL